MSSQCNFILVSRRIFFWKSTSSSSSLLARGSRGESFTLFKRDLLSSESQGFCLIRFRKQHKSLFTLLVKETERIEKNVSIKTAQTTLEVLWFFLRWLHLEPSPLIALSINWPTQDQEKQVTHLKMCGGFTCTKNTLSALNVFYTVSVSLHQPFFYSLSSICLPLLASQDNFLTAFLFHWSFIFFSLLVMNPSSFSTGKRPCLLFLSIIHTQVDSILFSSLRGKLQEKRSLVRNFLMPCLDCLLVNFSSLVFLQQRIQLPSLTPLSYLLSCIRVFLTEQ